VVSIPTLKARLYVEPLVREQELVSPIGIHKYEGASKVTGEMQDEPVTATPSSNRWGTGFSLPAEIGRVPHASLPAACFLRNLLPSFPCSAFR